MSPEQKGRLLCLTGNGVCDCPCVGQNAEQMNRIGQDRDLRKTIEREGGFHRVNVGLIAELLRNPDGVYYSHLDNEHLSLKGLQNVRNLIRRARWQLLLDLERNSGLTEIQCTTLREYIQKYNLDPVAYLAYLQKTLYQAPK